MHGTHLRMAKRGRPPHPIEKPEDIVRVAVEARKRDMAELGIVIRPPFGRTELTATDIAANRYCGTTLGRLYLRHLQSPHAPDSIDARQRMAGERWTQIIHNHARIMGYKLSYPSAGFEMVGGSRGGSSIEVDDDYAREVRGQYADCYRVIMDLGKELNRANPVGIALLLWAVCIENRDIRALSAHDIGNLRLGLNVLGKALI